jgi:hypothetical protein
VANADELFRKSAKSKDSESPTDYLLQRLKKWDSNKPMTVKAVRGATQNKTNFDFADTLAELKSQGLVKLEKQGKSEVIVLAS